jgi:hypothetical protein
MHSNCKLKGIARLRETSWLALVTHVATLQPSTDTG